MPLIAAGRTNPRVLIPLGSFFRKKPRMGRDFLGDAKAAHGGFVKRYAADRGRAHDPEGSHPFGESIR